jgi:transketolase N-terminal domain/subunit
MARPAAGAQTGLGQAEDRRNAFLDRVAERWSASGFSVAQVSGFDLRRTVSSLRSAPA